MYNGAKIESAWALTKAVASLAWSAVIGTAIDETAGCIRAEGVALDAERTDIIRASQAVSNETSG